MATGLLVILLGRGTRLSDRVMASDKVYEGVMRLGVRTDTEDVDGQVISETDASGVTEEAVRAAMARRVGDLMQTPPMISAVKKGGMPLYKLARKGQTVERTPRLIHIYDFMLLGYEPPRARFRLSCTKGTYVRTLCADIGEELGCGAFLESLRRISAGVFHVSDARPLAELLEMEPAAFLDCAIPVHRIHWGDEHGAHVG